jgi:hypothetical protein
VIRRQTNPGLPRHVRHTGPLAGETLEPVADATSPWAPATVCHRWPVGHIARRLMPLLKITSGMPTANSANIAACESMSPMSWLVTNLRDGIFSAMTRQQHEAWRDALEKRREPRQSAAQTCARACERLRRRPGRGSYFLGSVIRHVMNQAS